jgi:CheY-like chemotaxis protein
MSLNPLKPLLLIEDNPMDVDLTLRAFKRGQLTNPIEIARDGQEALDWIPRWQAGEPLPAVILLDLKLPKVDGLAVLKEIRSHEQFDKIPIIALTSSTENRDIEEAYRLGINSYIVKPVEFDKFIEVATQIKLYWMLLNEAPS